MSLVLTEAREIPGKGRLTRIAASTLNGLRDTGLALILPILILVAWQISAHFQLVSLQILPPPAQVLDIGLQMIANGEIPDALFTSMWRVMAGFSIGAIVGISLGAAMGLSRTFEAYVGPTVRAFCLVPTLAWIPFFMLVLGIGEGLKLAVIVKASFLPFALNSFEGIRAVPERYFDVARSFEFTRIETLRRLVLPAVLPNIFAGARLALGNAWKALVVVEMLAAAEGIGYLMAFGRLMFQLDTVLVTIAVIGLAGWTLDTIARGAERRFTRWSGHAA
jgi:sulfonate transport system permease protein